MVVTVVMVMRVVLVVGRGSRSSGGSRRLRSSSRPGQAALAGPLRAARGCHRCPVLSWSVLDPSGAAWSCHRCPFPSRGVSVAAGLSPLSRPFPRCPVPP